MSQRISSKPILDIQDSMPEIQNMQWKSTLRSTLNYFPFFQKKLFFSEGYFLNVNKKHKKIIFLYRNGRNAATTKRQRRRKQQQR